MADDGPSHESIFYALHDNGAIVHASDVARGLAANCRCAKCGQALMAVQGAQRIHHFRHQADVECLGGNETAIHLYAKAVICSQKIIALPSYIHIAEDLTTHPLIEARVFEFEDAAEEVRVGNRIADVLASRRGRCLAIEIFRTHLVDEDKTADYRAAGTSALEIDLSGLPANVLPEDLEQEVLYSAPRDWLHNEGARDQVAEIDAAVKVALKASNDRYGAYKARIISEIDRVKPMKLMRDDLTVFRQCYLDYIDVRFPGDYSIAAPSKNWEYELIRRLVLNQRFVKGGGRFTTRDAITSVRHYFSPILNAQHPEDYAERLAADLKPEFVLGGQIVIAYLKHLQKAELIVQIFDELLFQKMWAINRKTLDRIDPVRSSTPRPNPTKESVAPQPEERSRPQAESANIRSAEFWQRRAMELVEGGGENLRGTLFLMTYHPRFKMKPFDFIVDEQTLNHVSTLLREAMRR